MVLTSFFDFKMPSSFWDWKVPADIFLFTVVVAHQGIMDLVVVPGIVLMCVGLYNCVWL